jgi:hypothetical protein
MVRMMAFESDVAALLAKRPVVWTGSGYHANWHAAKKVPAAAPTPCSAQLLAVAIKRIEFS